MPRIVETAPFAPAPVDRPANITVVTPHNAAAAHLGAAPISLKRLGEEVVREAGLRIARPHEAKHELRRAVIWAKLDVPAGKYANRIRETVNTILRTGIDTAELEKHGSERLRPVAKITERYRSSLRSREMIDPEEVMLEAARIGSEPRPLLIYGYFRGRREEIEFIDRIAGEGSVYYLPCGDHDLFTINREWLRDLIARGWQESDVAMPPPFSAGGGAAMRMTGADGLSGGAVHAYALPDIDREARFVVGHAKRLAAGGARPESVAILCEDPDKYALKLAAASEEYGLPLDLSHSVPIAETRFGSYLQKLADVVETECDHVAAAHLMQDALNGLDTAEELWREARKHRFTGFEKWKEQAPEIDCLEWPEELNAGDWCERVAASLDRLKVRDAVKENARDLNALEKFEAALKENAENEPGVMSREHFLAVLRDILSEEQVKFDPAVGGVRVLNAKTAAGGSFKHVIIPGMAEGMVPANPQDNPVVDFHERNSLAEHGIIFESASDVARWNTAEFYFGLLTAEESLTLTFPETLENKEKVPSPFFAMLGIERFDNVPAYISSPLEALRFELRRAEADEEVISDARRRLELEMLRESKPGAGDHDGVLGRRVDPYEIRWSVSQLTKFGQCEFRWFSSKLLKLDMPDEKAEEMDVRVRGSFFHKVMEIAGRRAIGAEDQRAAMHEALEEAFAEAEKDEEMAVTELPDWHLRRGSYLNQLRKVLDSRDLIEEGSRIVAVESWYETEWQGLALVGKIDRIDETPEGMRAIDYKLGSIRPKGIKNEEGDLKTEVQLSLYTQAALPKLYPDREALEGAYYSLGKAKVISRAGEADPALEAFAEHLKHSFETGRFPVAPDHRRDACKYCDFVALCRRGSRLDRTNEDDGS